MNITKTPFITPMRYEITLKTYEGLQSQAIQGYKTYVANIKYLWIEETIEDVNDTPDRNKEAIARLDATLSTLHIQYPDITKTDTDELKITLEKLWKRFLIKKGIIK
jgi:hypothetical protein